MAIASIKKKISVKSSLLFLTRPVLPAILMFWLRTGEPGSRPKTPLWISRTLASQWLKRSQKMTKKINANTKCCKWAVDIIPYVRTILFRSHAWYLCQEYRMMNAVGCEASCEAICCTSPTYVRMYKPKRIYVHNMQDPRCAIATHSELHYASYSRGW